MLAMFNSNFFCLRNACRYLLLSSLLIFNSCYGWEDHPDVQDHRETDRLFKLAQKQSGVAEIEQLIFLSKEDVIAFCQKNNLNYEEIKDVIK